MRVFPGRLSTAHAAHYVCPPKRPPEGSRGTRSKYPMPLWLRFPDQREDGALRVRALDDPVAAGHLDRARSRISAAAGLHALHGRVDVADVEVVEPEGDRHHRRLGEHAADGLPAGGEQLISAHRSGVGVRLSASRRGRCRRPTPFPSRRRAVRASRRGPARSGSAGCSWPAFSHLSNAILAICGSTTTEKRLMLVMSFGGT